MRSDSNPKQLVIDLGKIGEQISANKAKLRRNFRHDFPLDIDLYGKIVFDLTHKDFEYFICQFLSNAGIPAFVSDTEFDQKGIDIVAEKDGKKYGYQCKQWSSPYLSLRDAGAIYAKLYTAQQEFGLDEVGLIITTKLSYSAEKFLKEHNIPFYNNADIIRGAKNLGLDDEAKWKRMNTRIREMRIQDIMDQRQQTRIMDEPRRDIRHELLKRRVYEISKHTTDYRDDGMRITFHYEDLRKLTAFQYWF